MSAKVILRVTKGELTGKEFAYSGKEQIFIGRQEDCIIVLPDKSRIPLSLHAGDYAALCYGARFRKFEWDIFKRRKNRAA